MDRYLKVLLWNEEVGRLAWDSRRNMAYFTFNPSFTRKGWDVSPLMAPINKVRPGMPVWGESKRLYQQLPAFLADSLPDDWGNQLFILWRQENHLSESEVSPIEKLSFIGKRGMGALEFVPETAHLGKHDKVDLKSLATLAERIFVDRDNAKILPEESITMQSLLAVGTSAGGRQPKAIIAINKDRSEIRSGQVAGYDGFEYYLLKFGNSSYCSAELEMTYYELAKAAGINMMDSELYEVDGNYHFLTKRFDRKGDKKLHTQTLAAMDPDAESYEQLIAVCRKLHLPETDCVEVFRRMVFNVLANNTDDHNKNFTFIMDDNGVWRLSPAYDITFIFNIHGFQPEQNHCLFIRSKLNAVSKEDVLNFARDNGIRHPDSIISQVVKSLRLFKVVASKYKVKADLIGRVDACITSHLQSWNEIKKTVSLPFDVDGHLVVNVCLEQALKGNLHLLANIDGHDRKYVIRKGSDIYTRLVDMGLSNVDSETLKELVSSLMLE